jgi:Ca-activated chloride channel family protein
MRPTVLLLLAFIATAGEALPPLLVKLPPGEQPCELRRLEVAAVVRGLLAEVTTTMQLANPNPRPLAGEVEFPLPDGATVCGYALDINGAMVDGVVVAQDRARVVLETESRQRIDPGLVEHVRGNLFRTRIFPLPANGSRTLTVTWTAALAVRGDEAALRLPLPRQLLPELLLRLDIDAGPVTPELGGFGDLKLTAWRSGHRAEARLTTVQPGDDLLVRLPRLPERLVQIEEHAGERFALISVAPPPAANKPAAPGRLAVAWDASGSVTEAAAQRARAALVALLRAAPGLVLDIVPFHIAREPARSFRDADELDRWLAALPRDGATGLAGLDLRRAALPDAGDAGWLLVCDGFGTWGEGLPACGDVPVVCLVAEAQRDDALLRLIAARSGGMVLDLATATPAETAAAIIAPPRSLPLVEAAAGVLDAVQVSESGGRVLVLARLRSGGRASLAWRGCAPLELQLDPAAAVAGRVVARGWAGARAAALAVFPEANRGELLALGRTYGLVTAGTSLLVLENLDQYLRHGVEPPESLPDLRRQWALQMKQRGDQRLADLGRHQQQLIAWWDERIRWWDGRLPPPPVLKDAQERPAAASAPAPAPAGREEAVADREMGGQGALLSIGAGGNDGGARKAGGRAGGGADRASSITIAGWNPDTPWLRALRAAPAAGAYRAWLEQRAALAGNPSAALDCAGFLLPLDRAAGLRVLSNLAEMRLDDPALLRVLAWRLQDAGELDVAVTLLRRVLRLRPEEPQSYRDLALALGLRWESGRRAEDAQEALALLLRVVERRPLQDSDLGEHWAIEANWSRFPQCEIIALEEFNRLAARCGPGVAVPEIDQRLRANLDCDLRVVMAWDADATDIDLHVRQPDREIAFYGRNRTSAGGLVSPDCTRGYGPEEYLIRRAPGGEYQVFVRYFGSQQTGLLGPATVTATVFTDWGRPGERSQRLTLRLDRQGEQIPVGAVQIGGGTVANPGVADGTKPASLDRARLAGLRKGMSRAQVETLLGRPERDEGSGIFILVYRLADGASLRVGLGPDLLWVREVTQGAERDLLR